MQESTQTELTAATKREMERIKKRKIFHRWV